MRKLAVMAVLATTALASPALAKDGAWYVGVEGGGLLVEDMDFDIGTAKNASTADTHYGYDVGGYVGYDFGPFKIEGETSYKRARTDSYRSALPIPTQGGAPAPAGYYEQASGKNSALSFMLNGLLDFGNEGITGYVGGGVGVARVKLSDYRVSGPNPFLDDSDTRFAYQGIAGVALPVTQNIDVGVRYRFFNVDNVRLVSRAGTNYETRFRSHSVLGTLSYNFGEPTPPPPPPPPPPPVVETPGPFIVFFDWDKSAITPEAASILDNAAQAYATTGQASVMLAGHADKSGSPSYNVGLSQRRADAVKSYLAGKGIPDTAMSTEAFGESRPLVETADGVREPQNRRVEITYGPGSGQ